MADKDEPGNEPISQAASSDDTNMKNTGQDSNAQSDKPTKKPEEPKPPSRLKQLWDKVGIDFMTVSLMFKGSLPPTIALAMYQSPAVAGQFGNLGYLVAITSILGFCIMPRGKFIQTMILNTFAACLSAAVNLLAIYTAVQARMHTTPPGSPPTGYNSSASAVCGVWLFVQVYLINVVRGARPQFNFPAIIYNIFVAVSMTYATQFPNMAYSINFMKRLLTAFLTGFALATGVHFLVFPTSSRKVLFMEMTGFLMCISGMLKAQTAYMQSLETIDPVALRKKQEEEASAAKKKSKKDNASTGPLVIPVALKLKEVHGKTVELSTKIHADVTPAKREFAIGKLESHDLTELWKLLRFLFVPVNGLSASIDILQGLAAERDWSHEGETKEETQQKRKQIENLHFLMKQLHEPFASMTADVEGAIMHVLLTLELVKPPKKKGDEESKGDAPVPGTATFTATYKAKVDEFYQSKQKTLKDWCREHDIDIPDDFFESNFVGPDSISPEGSKRDEYQRQLLFTLYLEFLLWRTGAAVLEIVLWADQKKQDGVLKHSKLIFPGSKTLYKWLKAVVGQEDASKDGHVMAGVESVGSEGVFLGDDFARRKDPEHLPPRDVAERFGEALRATPQFFRSDASAFGFRVACATMSIAIVCYLRDSQAWFLQQRLLWAMIMVSLSMTRTAGQSAFTFGEYRTFAPALRILGTLIAMIGSYIIWYIVDGRTAGVLVFLWLWIFAAWYFVLKVPKLTIVAILSLVTSVLIIGYELQVRELGVAAATANGQPAYPTYLLAPYRLATVMGGLFVAYMWTLFPYPVSESSELRRDLGATLYLLSNFYSVMHETVQARVRGTDGDPNVKGTHAHNLEKARNAVLSKLLLLITDMKTNAAFSKFQLRVGGRFPREEYESLIECCSRLTQSIALIGYASRTFSLHTSSPDRPELSQWSTDFRKLLVSINPTSHRYTSLLALLSSSLANGAPLPPYLEMPPPFEMIKKIETIDPDLLSIRHIAEPEYSAFAVVQISAQTVNADILELTKHVKNLVGEIDFTFHAVKSSQASTDSSSLESQDDKGKIE